MLWQWSSRCLPPSTMPEISGYIGSNAWRKGDTNTGQQRPERQRKEGNRAVSCSCCETDSGCDAALLATTWLNGTVFGFWRIETGISAALVGDS